MNNLEMSLATSTQADMNENDHVNNQMDQQSTDTDEESPISERVAEREVLLDLQEGSSNSNVNGSSLENNSIDVDGTSVTNGNTSSNYNIQAGGIRGKTNRYLLTLGRHFNVLDRFFHKPTEVNDQHGASYDGVFSNLTAKPTPEVPEEVNEDFPPTYTDAANDMSPSYYGANADGTNMFYDEICIEGLPVGNVANLIWNIIVSTSFQFIGFLITYVLHTSHAAKQGSRFGLGLTFIGYGYSMVPSDVTSKVGKGTIINRVKVSNPNDYDDLRIDEQNENLDTFTSTLSHGVQEEKKSLPLLAIVVGGLGLYISIKSLIDYVKVKRMEKKYLAQDDPV
ncbi:hypothetical protein TPHA_0C04150 [Tetrapisispora phaffii CBS 4417]|uniref:Metal homeostatis protein bsd2 n=1 Tax=Tetrapisispora phaffii (strain ATCC 24235 / CBS 4417 / NBRC 1672 / NRRL Y-8282 / UCD 70-5) TaxID=1071381 RepID=G8BQQ3_TETPH|nr:hypothetical protein TPHA_0C04150 [Tetrapisispora phaffii CBS 4417]CCE62565.1 hypothetical protein TPHA_0C04150 [Tetrapisispora phaffii CBS 4417]